MQHPSSSSASAIKQVGFQRSSKLVIRPPKRKTLSGSRSAHSTCPTLIALIGVAVISTWYKVFEPPEVGVERLRNMPRPKSFFGFTQSVPRSVPPDGHPRLYQHHFRIRPVIMITRGAAREVPLSNTRISHCRGLAPKISSALSAKFTQQASCYAGRTTARAADKTRGTDLRQRVDILQSKKKKIKNTHTLSS